MRKFETGATRDTDEGKLDYRGFLSPLSLRAFARYMNTHRTQPDGSVRASDNWKKGIPMEAYMSSAWRHFMDVYGLFEAGLVSQPEFVEALCALMFNIQGMLHEIEKGNSRGK